MDGLTYLPMERSLWLQAQCFMNEAEQNFPNLVSSAVFFKENLVSTSMELSALRPVCRYLFQYPPHKAQMRLEGPPAGVLLALSHRSAPVHVAGTQLHLHVFKAREALCSCALYASGLTDKRRLETLQLYSLCRVWWEWRTCIGSCATACSR